jgi:predicted GNAT family acetyltransferase
MPPAASGYENAMRSFPDAHAATEVRRNPERSRYELIIDGRLAGIVDYRQSGSMVVLPHTEILPTMRGRGLAARLVRSVLDDLRENKNKVVARCWFVAEYVKAHPEYQDLLAA